MSFLNPLRNAGGRASEVSTPKARKWAFVGPLVVLLAALLAVAPELIHGPSCGHDFDFHLASWLDVQSAWQHGLFYPHWAPSANFGAGEARFVFYPPLTWMLGAALGLILPWTLVPATLTFLLLAGTGLATRALGGEALSDGAATLAGCVALFSGYSLFTAYERTAFGELAGGFWVPLLLLFALRWIDPLQAVSARRTFPQGLKPKDEAGAFAARLKSCPVTKQQIAGENRQQVAGEAKQQVAGGIEQQVAGETWGTSSIFAAAIPLALVVAGAWLSNAPLGVMASYLLAFVALIAAAQARSWVPLIRAALGTGMGLALSSFYLIPAAYEQRWVNIAQATDDPGERIENSFLFGRHADPALALHDVELHRVSWLAVSMLAVALVGIVLLWWRGSEEDFAPYEIQSNEESFPQGLKPGSFWGSLAARVKSGPFKASVSARQGARSQAGGCAYWLPLGLIPLAILILQLPVSLPVWNLLPKLRFLQFPWRWLVALEAPMGIFLAAAVWPGDQTRRWVRGAVAAGFAMLFVAISVYTARSFFQACDDEDAVAGMLSVYRAGSGFAGSDEYAPVGADNTLAASALPGACFASDPMTPLGVAPVGDAPAAEGDEAPTPVWKAGQNSCAATFAMTARTPEHFSVAGTAAHGGFLILRLRSFPAWRASLNGQPVTTMAARADGLIAVPVVAGKVDLRLDWAATPDVLLGRWISGLAALLITALCALNRRRSGARLS
jgi:hypothetical protein